MKLTVLVPIYNVSKYLDKCLASLHDQTLNDMEILCLNDGSTDDSKSIIEKYVQMDSRFRLIDKENTGYGNTMNVGLDSANGEYIGIVESDDYVEPIMFEELLKKIEEGNSDIIKSNFYNYSEAEETLILEDILKDLPKDKNINPLEEAKIFLVLQSIWSAVYRTDFLAKNNIRFHETPGASFQDVSFAFQVFANTDKVQLTDKAYYHYRISNPNSSVKMVNKIDKLCGEIGLIEELVERHVNKERLKTIASRLAYRILLENYFDAPPAYQFAMLTELQHRLRIYESRGDLDDEIWEQEAVDTAREILADKDAYYKKTGKKIFDYRLLQDTLNLSIYKEALLEKAKAYKSIIIYGAGKVGQDIKNDLIAAGCDNSKLSFAVTEMGTNPSSIDGVRVKSLEKYLQIKNEAVVIIAVKEASQYEILQNLKNLGFKNIITLTDEIRRV